jgi:hypothetical protein
MAAMFAHGGIFFAANGAIAPAKGPRCLSAGLEKLNRRERGGEFGCSPTHAKADQSPCNAAAEEAF